MYLEKRLLAKINEKPDDLVSQESGEDSKKGGLSTKHKERFKALEGLAITDTQKGDIAKWKKKAEQGDKKALDKIENNFEDWKEVGEKYKKAHEAIMKHGGGHKKEALDLIKKALEDKSGINSALHDKKELFGSFINTFETNQKKIEKQVKDERVKAKKIWNEKIGKFSVFSKKERKAESEHWKKELTGKYLRGKNPEFTVDKLLSQTEPRLKKLESEAKERKKVTQERADISEIFKDLAKTKAPKGHASLGISNLLKSNFSNMDLKQKQSLIENIKKAANKKTKNKGSTASEAVGNFFKEQREYPKDPKERYNALEEQGLGISDWSNAKKHFEASIAELKDDEDLSAKDQRKLLQKFEEHIDNCDIALSVNKIRDAVDKDSNALTGLGWEESLNAHLKYQEQLNALKNKNSKLPKNELVQSKIEDLDDQIKTNIAICEKEVIENNISGNMKGVEAIEDIKEIINDNTEAENELLGLAALGNERIQRKRKGEAIDQTETLDQASEHILDEAIDNKKEIDANLKKINVKDDLSDSQDEVDSDNEQQIDEVEKEDQLDERENDEQKNMEAKQEQEELEQEYLQSIDNKAVEDQKPVIDNQIETEESINFEREQDRLEKERMKELQEIESEQELELENKKNELLEDSNEVIGEDIENEDTEEAQNVQDIQDLKSDQKKELDQRTEDYEEKTELVDQAKNNQEEMQQDQEDEQVADLENQITQEKQINNQYEGTLHIPAEAPKSEAEIKQEYDEQKSEATEQITKEVKKSHDAVSITEEGVRLDIGQDKNRIKKSKTDKESLKKAVIDGERVSVVDSQMGRLDRQQKERDLKSSLASKFDDGETRSNVISFLERMKESESNQKDVLRAAA